SRMNLVSRNTLENAWARHFEDSLQLLPLLPEGSKILFDLGSGAGFPGLVIAICRADIKVHLVESTGKGAIFWRLFHVRRVRARSCIMQEASLFPVKHQRLLM